MHHPEQPILLVGLTARMLAELAVNASYRVLAVDYFGDTDLQARCHSVSLRHDYGRDYSAAALVDVANSLPAAGVVYGASLENHPAEVARLADSRKLLGNSPETLEQVRNPILLAEAIRAGGFAGPQTVLARAGVIVDPTQRWLWSCDRRSYTAAYYVDVELGFVGWQDFSAPFYVRAVSSKNTES